MYLTGGSDGFRNTCLQEGWSFFVHLDHLLGREVKMGVVLGLGICEKREYWAEEVRP
jgi:hypothetical protein